MAKKKRRARARKGPGGVAWRTHFGRTAKACFAKGVHSGKEFGRCMKANL
jgi:hypothetical protein